MSTVTSASLATGKNGVAMGSAEGFTDAGGAVSAVDILDNLTLISGTFASGEATTKAATTADGSLAISLAGQTAVDVIVNNEEPVGAGGFVGQDTASFALPAMPKRPVELPDEVTMLIGNRNDECQTGSVRRFAHQGLLETGDKVCEEIGPFLHCSAITGKRCPLRRCRKFRRRPDCRRRECRGSAVFSSGKGTASAETDGSAGSEGFVDRIYGLNMNPEIESETFTGADLQCRYPHIRRVRHRSRGCGISRCRDL